MNVLHFDELLTKKSLNEIIERVLVDIERVKIGDGRAFSSFSLYFSSFRLKMKIIISVK